MKNEKLKYTLKVYILPVILVIAFGVGIYRYGIYRSSRQYYIRAWELVQKKTFYYACEYLKEALRQDPSFTSGWELYGKIYTEALSDYSYGLSILNQGIKKSSHPTPVMFFLRGKCKNRLGQRTEAISDFEKTIRMDPGIDSSYVYLGTLYESLDEEDQAEHSYTEALRRFPRSSNLLLARGRCFFKSGQYDKARHDLNTALSIRENGEAFYYLGLCLLKQGKRKDACVEFANAITHDYEIAREKENMYCLESPVIPGY